MPSLAGKFIVLDGPDGCGKTTQLDLLARHLESSGHAITRCKDPGGTPIGDRIRHLLLDYDLSEMDVRCEALLFMASRAQLVADVISPALQAGGVVLCDRFVSSTCAYQGAAGFDVQRVLELAPYAIGDVWPDLTIVLDIDVETGFARTGRKPHHAGKNRKQNAGQQDMFADAVPDAMESRPLEFHRKVRDCFLVLAEKYPRPIKIINSDADAEAVHRRVVEVVEGFFGIGAAT